MDEKIKRIVSLIDDFKFLKGYIMARLRNMVPNARRTVFIFWPASLIPSSLFYFDVIQDIAYAKSLKL